MSALGLELIRAGHQVTLFHMCDAEQFLPDSRIRFHPIGVSDHPAGSLRLSLAQLSRLEGKAALRFTIRAVAKTTEMFLRDAPDALRESRVDAILADQMEPAGKTIADRMGLPFVTVCSALAINRDPQVPPPFTPWRFRRGAFARLRNSVGYLIGDRVTSPISRVTAEYRQRWGLPPLRSQEETFSSLAQICQMPRDFDFPRALPPEGLHYTGPLRFEEDAASFPWKRLNGLPIVYASLGTLQNQRLQTFRTIAEACSGGAVQLVIAHGGGLTAEDEASLPGNPLVLPYVPQRALLAKAALTIAHAGLNTVLDSLSFGVPMILTPITFEQPAIARRAERCGAARVIPFGKLSASRLRELIAEVGGASPYRRAALKMAESIALAGGAAHAAKIVETVVTSALKSAKTAAA